MSCFNKLLLLIFLCTLTSCGFGTYQEIVQMLPKEEGNWVKPRWGVSSREYHCSEDWLSTGAVLAQAKKVAQAFLWIPLPWTSNNEYKPNIQAPFYLGISFRKNFKISSCLTTMVSIQSEKTGNPISPKQNCY